MNRKLVLRAGCTAAIVFAFASAPTKAYRPPESVSDFGEAQKALQQYCLACHQGKAAVGGFDLTRLNTMESMTSEPRKWTRVVSRIREGEMPPKGVPALSMPLRENLVKFLDTTLRTAACTDGISPVRAPIRRLNRNEYAATLRDLLNIHINAGSGLPADGAGGEGFDNAAETLFLSPMHAEKFLEAAKVALDYAMKDTRSRSRFMVAEPGATVTSEEAAAKVVKTFLPRAFRRPVADTEVEKYMALFRGAQSRGESYDDSIFYVLQGILVSPHFLFRLEQSNASPEPRLLDDYALASRLSYFLWGSMPDDTLFELAAAGKLKDEDVLIEQISRMRKDIKTREFAEQFVEQWLNTRELGRDIKPDPVLFKEYYDAEISAAMRYEPILFFQELITENLSLLNLIDSKWTFVTNKLSRFYGFDIQGLRQQPKRVELPDRSHRGGLLGMSAVLAVSSYPSRTSPVLRGKWILESMLGDPPPPPPPNTPELEKEHAGEPPKTMRERLSRHRADPACATCHNRIDPLGFGLENFDVLGRWRTEEAGKPIDAKGELPDGKTFSGPEQLKAILLDRKEGFLRNLTSKMLGYALGRGLTTEDYCTVDQIVKQLKRDDYSAHTLIRGIVLSVPFRYQVGTAPNRAVAMSRPQSTESKP